MFTFTVAVFARSEFDLDSDDFAAEFIAPPFQYVGRVTVRALSRRDAAAAAYYRALGRQRAAFLRQLGAPEAIRTQEDDMTRIRREIIASDAVSAEHGVTFDYALNRTNVETFFFSVRPVAPRSPRMGRCRNRIPALRACRLTRQLLQEPMETRRN